MSKIPSQVALCLALFTGCDVLAADLHGDTCYGFDEMWGTCPDLPSCEDCKPVDCEFSDWGEWYDSLGRCTGLRFRERTISVVNNECGTPCVGSKIESVEHVPEECLLNPVDCALSDWSEWSRCQNATGQVFRQRTVLRPPESGGEPCTGSLEETLPCGSGPAPVPCVFSNWQEWTSCSSTCGVGRHTRMRRILSEARHSGEACEGLTLETKACSDQECGGRDCVLGDWSDWSMCDPERHPQRYRRRQVKQNAMGTGYRCNQTLKETQGCPEFAEEPCRLSDWSEWEALGWHEPNPPRCSRECGGGQTFRTRFMQAPPAHGGSCPDSSLKQLKACNTQPCNAECQMSDWSQWSTCSADCGKGTMTRSRTLLNLEAKFSIGCDGALEEALPCLGKEGVCPQTDCTWSQWNDWSSCSASCGGGVARRMRALEALPRNGGAACAALTKSEAVPCNMQPCGKECINGKWGDWHDWESCTASCDGGFHVRRRSIEQYPNECGRPADGVKHEYKPCEGLPKCVQDVDCVVSDWGEWSFCSRTCYGASERNRYIKVFPAGSGKSCDNTSLKETAPCNPGPAEEAAEGCRAPGPADCALSEWGDWSWCSSSCGGGQRERRRKVLTLPRGGGKTCDAGLAVLEPCNPEPCQMEDCQDCVWGEWSDWGDCSGCQGERYRHRSIQQMPNHCGRICDLKSAKEVSNCTGHCEEKLFCAWTEWSSPAGCGVGCGPGTMIRSRALTLTNTPVDTSLFTVDHGGRCQGAQLNMSVCPATTPCRPPCIPRDCEFSAWGEWSAPASSGLCERQRGITSGNECGKPCSGRTGETKRCMLPNPDLKNCALSDWTAWSPCHMNVKVGQRHRERSVIQEPSFDGTPCSATTHESEQCNTKLPVDCELSEWGDWDECHRSCGGGVQSRQRQILAHAEFGGALCEDNLAEMRMCNEEPCIEAKEDCLYSGWTSWSGCGTDGQRYRERGIERYASGSGEFCDGDLEQTEPCAEEDTVDCVVSDWTTWDDCDALCGGGQMRRQRQIMVFPTAGGQVCPSELIQTKGCNLIPCSFRDCQVGDWQTWSECSTSCGVGQRQRSRAVLHIRDPEGVGCNQDLVQISDCTSALCQQDDCQWGEWEDWSGCSCSCNGGQQTRVRHIAQMPSSGGKLCEVRDKAEVRACNTQSCSAPRCRDGLWGDWDAWSACSQSCGGGTIYRSRQVVQMANECGSPVTGKARETAMCNMDTPCEPPVDCLFSDWGVWSACSQTCNGVMRRSRRIQRYGSGAGAFCGGALKDISSCNPVPGEGPSPCDVHLEPPVNCQLSEWSDWATCSTSCGGGEAVRTREIAIPAAHGGEACEGPLSVVRQCAMAECPGPEPVDCEYGDWQDWGACGKCGGERTRFRHITQYARHGGKACEPFEAEEVGACPRQCGDVQFCTWGDWDSWSECTAKCGKGKRMRRRYLGLSDEAAAPPAPVQELMGLYSELRTQAKTLEGKRTSELLMAFSCGLFSFVVALAGIRTFMTLQARSRSTHASRVGRTEELAATELPLVGIA